MLVANHVTKSEKMSIEEKRACNDMLRNAQTGMMSWAEKNFRQKLIDNLFRLSYYKDNQTIYLNDTPKKEKTE